MATKSREPSAPTPLTRVRLDKWLWAARFYKTRSLAKQAIEGGKVSCDGNKAKPSKEIGMDCVISLRQGFDEKTVLVTGLPEQRRGAPEAQALYAETQESIENRERLAAQRKAQPVQWLLSTKPDKKQRRLIHRFKNRPEN